MNSTLISIVARSSTESYQVSDGFFQPEICVQLFCLATTGKAFLIFPSTFVWILLSSFKISIVILLVLCCWSTPTRGPQHWPRVASDSAPENSGGHSISSTAQLAASLSDGDGAC